MGTWWWAGPPRERWLEVLSGSMCIRLRCGLVLVPIKNAKSYQDSALSRCRHDMKNHNGRKVRALKRLMIVTFITSSIGTYCRGRAERAPLTIQYEAERPTLGNYN